MARSSEWRYIQHIPRFAWKDTDDPKYIKDRDETFAKNGNGWWWSANVQSNRFSSQIRKNK